SSGSATCASVEPGWPCCPPGFRPLLLRNDLGAGLANGESDDGGLTNSDCSAPTVPATRQSQPEAALSARPALQPKQQAPHRTEANQPAPHHDQRTEAEIN